MPQLSIVRKSALLIALPFVIQMSFGVALLVVAQSRRTIAIVVASLALNLIVAGPMAIAFHRMAASLAAANKDLQYAGREMEAFSYSVSHDLRAPLRAIDGFSRILEEEFGPTLDAEGKRILGVIRRNTINMAELIDDLLAFSRLSRQPVARVEVDMTALARQAYAEASRGAGNRNIEFDLHELPPASGDLAMLRQVFTNLLSNAVKFTGPRADARIEVGCTEDGAGCIYYVKDNGVGFDDRYTSKLFGVFQRLHLASEFDGTGVGLAIVQRVVQRHGGRVWAESVAGSGATFYFTLADPSAEQGDNEWKKSRF